METKKRSFVKSIVWRLIAIINGTLVAFIFTHNVFQSFSIGIVGNLSGFVLYYIHERFWNKTKYGIIENEH